MKIAVLAGDGIGPEIVAQAVRVLEALRSDGLKIELEPGLLGGCAVDAAGEPFPEATRKLAEDADAVILGAVGGPQYDVLPRALRPEKGMLGIRKALNLVCQSSPGAALPRARQRLDLEARGSGGPGHSYRARIDRRHLFRRATGHRTA